MKENQRVKLTKRILKESLIRLLKDRSIHKISVRELCEEADINRSTFYKYFDNQYDLFDSIQQDFLAQINDYFDKEKHVQDEESFFNVMQYIDQNEDIVSILMQNVLNDDLLEQLLRLPMIHVKLQENFSSGDIRSRSELDYTYDFIVNGAFSMIKNWISKEERESPEEIAGLLLELVGRISQ